MDSQELSYPIVQEPEPGSVVEVSEGVLWTRMPLPFSGLPFINLYLVGDGDGWAIIDTGLRGREIQEAWENIFANHLGGRPVTRVLATHYHPDHIGQAGWLTERWNCRLWMTRTDFLYARMLTMDNWDEVPDEAVAFYRAAGYDDEMIAVYRERVKLGFAAGMEPLPVGYRRVVDGEAIGVGDRTLQVVVGRGHAPEHACYHDADAKLLFSGDQVLPHISSNISVYPTEPDDNPLEDWIASKQHIPTRVTDDVLVLPAHGKPFRGLHARCARLAAKHERAFDRLVNMLDRPRRAIDCFPALFRQNIGDGDRGLAMGETLAHLNALIARDLVVREQDRDGIHWYVRIE